MMSMVPISGVVGRFIAFGAFALYIKGIIIFNVPFNLIPAVIFTEKLFARFLYNGSAPTEHLREAELK